MLLAADVGNSNIVFALIEGGEVRHRWRIATDSRRTGDEYAVWLHQLLELNGLDRSAIDAMIIATVVPRALHNLEVLATKYLGVTPLVAGSAEAPYGMAIDLPNPREVGADRVVNAVAAYHAHPDDLIIIDFGTATTFDVVDFTGVYKGGVICPGINLSLDALVNAAAKLPRIAIEAPDGDVPVIGRSTEEAMHSGIFWGYVAMIEGLTQRIKAEVARPMTVIATGGLALLFDKHTSVFDHLEPDLTLKGLALIHARASGA